MSYKQRRSRTYQQGQKYFPMHSGFYQSRIKAKLALADWIRRFREEMGYVPGTRIRKTRYGYVVETKPMVPPKGAVWENGKWVLKK